jgi:NADH-quinone oxidoreductase subunit C
VNTALTQELKSVFSDLEIAAKEETRLAVNAPKGHVLSILSYLKDSGFDHLALVSCVDWIDEAQLELVYILSRYMKDNDTYTDKDKVHVILKTRIPRERPEFQTVTPIFPNAEPYERELHELFGVHFQGHKRLTPLLLDRKYDIPPFRKDFDMRKYVEDVFGSIPTVEDQG